ncbi:glycoside hydrolase family 65 protein [Planosporangium mesophilum]|uniref:Hydrolase n=1 Tax=Planosporangium mesophilum TaxID=689768 RepID=A0A8J3T9A1_9ACTN|nr:glycoside hydrolase family 65 protein [Planosporangium mesophilum]NJC84082.1 glycoside hydrolase family 65 protein [Planosporangium mesophilum]GII22915.1 hydrolase [Planosporangium mesophilum]
MTDVISPDPVTEWHPRYLPAYLSNGVVGMRVGKIPMSNGVSVLSGFEGLDPANEVEAFARAPYPLGGDLSVDGVTLSASPERFRLGEYRYDFSCGELSGHFTFEGEHARAEVDILDFCSRTQPTLVLQEIDLRVDRDCDLTIAAVIDTRGLPGSWVDREVDPGGTLASQPVDGLLRWRSFGGLSTCGVAYVTTLNGTDEFDRIFDRSRIGPLSTTYSFRAEAGRRYRLRRMVSLLPQALHDEPHIHAVRMLQGARLRGFDGLRADNRAAWRELWKGRVVLVGAPTRWQALADAAYFYLHTSAHPSSPSSTSLFGLAYWPNYHYYRGHIMWDIEMFALPLLTVTYPEAARALLNFRRTRLPGARSNAAAVGRGGVQFPWESSLRHGQEAAPVDAPAAAVEHHVSMDVAVAFARFLHASGDSEFARERAWPVLSGVAEWLDDRLERTERGYEIRYVNGVAQTNTTVNNNAFVNMAAIVALREAAALGRALGRGEPDAWERLAAEVVLPIDRDNGIILNHDDYDPDEEKGETPEAPAGLFPLGFDVDPETERRTLSYYLRFAHRYAGAPMLSSMLGVYAARIDDRDAARELFERGYADFVVEPFRITTEFSPKVYPDQPVAGPFTANLGGFLTACVYGLTGVRLRDGPPESWCERPVRMPRGWDGVHVERLWARREPTTLTGEHGDDHARLVPHSPP